MTMKGSPSNVCKISWLSLASAFVPAALLLLLLPGASQAAVFLQEVTEHPGNYLIYQCNNFGHDIPTFDYSQLSNKSTVGNKSTATPKFLFQAIVPLN